MLKRPRSLALWLLLFSFPVQARTLTSLIADSRLLAKDTASGSRQRFSNTQITDWLNEGQRLMISRTWCLEKATQIELVSGTTYYSLPSDFLAVRRVTRDHLLLNELSLAALDSRSSGWQTASGLPVYYFVSYSSRGVIGFAPFPGASTDTGTIRMDYFQQPGSMSSGTDTPFNGVAELTGYHEALPYFVAARMAFVDGRDGPAAAYSAVFEAYIKSMDEKCKSRPSYLPSATGKFP